MAMLNIQMVNQLNSYFNNGRYKCVCATMCYPKHCLLKVLAINYYRCIMGVINMSFW